MCPTARRTSHRGGERPRRGHRGGAPPRIVVRLGIVAGVGLALYGGVLVAPGALALAGITNSPSDPYALRWHVFCWDLWFLVWGLALAVAARRARRRVHA